MTTQGPIIYVSNDLRALGRRLAEVLREKPLPPLEQETIVVQSQGMRRWLMLELAHELGCSASINMPFPGKFCRQLTNRLAQPEEPVPPVAEGVDEEVSLFGRDTLRWRVHALLEKERSDKVFRPISRYLADKDPRKRFQLAVQIANRLDDYQIYRSQMLLAWEASSREAERLLHSAWQAVLWRELCKNVPADDEHLARRFDRLIAELGKKKKAPAGLPKRISVFGVNSLPPIFIRLMRAVAHLIPVEMYVVVPTLEFKTSVAAAMPVAPVQEEVEEIHVEEAEEEFEDDGPRRQLMLFDEPPASKKKRSRKSAAKKTVAPAQVVSVPVADTTPDNSLNQSLGKQVRDLISLLRGPETDPTEWQALDFVVPERDSCLHALQHDIVNGVDGVTREKASRYQLRARDRSLLIHVCHSPLREMEVLRDQLLATFEEHPELRPHDILVMVPDIELYAPYIQAVFGIKQEGLPRLKHRTADRNLAREQPLSSAILQIMDLTESRLCGAEVLDLLEVPAIRRAAGIEDEDLPVLRHWVEETNIRWGEDGEQRSSVYGLPSLDANTWRAGIDRLLLGYATGPVEAIVMDRLPYGEATTSRAELLGKFSTWLDMLFKDLEALREQRTLKGWSEYLLSLMSRHFEVEGEDEERTLKQVRKHLGRLADIADVAVLKGKLDGVVIRDHLDLVVSDDSFGSGFIGGSITFCALKPMRTIPFKVIAVAGLGEAHFPRKNRPPAFDLQACDPQPGDRNLREDDRQLFLETLLAARERLILSYVGRSQKDNSELAPSVVVSELLDYIDQSCKVHGEGTPRKQLVVEHPLQPFSRAYYDGKDERLFSYSEANRAAVEVAQENQAKASPRSANPFVIDPLTVEKDEETIELRDLIVCWTNPSRHFCEHVLDLRLERSEGDLEDAEPFAVDSLMQYDLHEWMTERHLQGERDQAVEAVLVAARGEVPPKHLGQAWHARVDAELELFLERIGQPAYEEPVTVRFSGDGWILSGRIDGLTGKERLQYRPTKLKPKDLIRAWILHVALNAWADLHPGTVPQKTRLIGLEESVRFPPLEGAKQRLDALVAEYMDCRKAPLPVFEKASYGLVDQRIKLENPKKFKARKDPKRVAQDEFHGRAYKDGGRGDCEDPHIALCFRGRDPFDDESFDEFERLAELFWRPVFDAKKE